MKIAVDIRSLMNAQYSGVGQYLIQCLSRLIVLGEEHHFYLFYNSYKDVKVPFENSKNVTLIGLHYPNKLLNASFVFIGEPKISKLLNTEIDFIWMPNLNFFPHKETTPLVLTVHDLSFEVSKDYFSFKRNCWHQVITPKKLMDRAKMIFAISESTALDLQEIYKIPSSKIKMIHSGITVPAEEKIPKKKLKEVIQKYNLPKEYILYLGNIEPRKNIVGMIKAFDEFKLKKGSAIKLVLAGAFAWKYKKVLKAIEVSPFKKDILCLGYISEEEKGILYKQAKLFLFPSFYEGFGFPVLEALLQKIPVVTSLSSSMPEISCGKAVLVDPYNISEIARGIELGLRQQITEKDIAPLKNKFNWDNTAKKMLSAWEGLL